VATILVVLASTLLLALGGSVALATATEGAIAASYRDGVATLYAAEAAAGIAAARLAESDQWAPSAGAYVSGRLDRLLGVGDVAYPPGVTVSLVDGGAADRIAIVAEATGAGGAKRAVRVTLGRAVDAHGDPSVRTLAWEEVR
jgi:hypothetical protein